MEFNIAYWIKTYVLLLNQVHVFAFGEKGEENFVLEPIEAWTKQSFFICK